MRPTLVGIVGATGSGKSTIRDHLNKNHGFKSISMAGPLKEMLLVMGLSEQDVFGSQEHRLQGHPLLGGKTPRWAAQSLGTEWGRQCIHADLWVNVMQQRIQKERNKTNPHPIVIDDLRFPNEFEMVKRLGGEVWRIRRKSVERMPTVVDEFCASIGWFPRIHESEFHWSKAPADFVFRNDVEIAHLLTIVDRYLKSAEWATEKEAA